MSGFIYAIECGQRIKIGFSEKPELRFNKIASDAPFPCQMLGYWPGDKSDELDVHAKFNATRVHGEWFAATEALLGFVADNNTWVKQPKAKDMPANNADRIIQIFGGLTGTAKALSAKVPTVQGWKIRDRIPQQHWLPLIAAAKDEGFALSLSDFLKSHNVDDGDPAFMAARRPAPQPMVKAS